MIINEMPVSKGYDIFDKFSGGNYDNEYITKYIGINDC